VGSDQVEIFLDGEVAPPAEEKSFGKAKKRNKWLQCVLQHTCSDNILPVEIFFDGEVARPAEVAEAKKADTCEKSWEGVSLLDGFQWCWQFVLPHTCSNKIAAVIPPGGLILPG